MSLPEAVERDPLDVARLATSATLRKVASWGDQFDRDDLYDIAAQLETSTVEQLRTDGCCPVCEEVTCDEDCPLVTVRQRLDGQP